MELLDDFSPCVQRAVRWSLWAFSVVTAPIWIPMAWGQRKATDALFEEAARRGMTVMPDPLWPDWVGGGPVASTLSPPNQ